jgi:Co/Zn/Cd efflux system component
LIVPRTWTLLNQVAHIFMQGESPNVDLRTLERKLMEITGVIAGHDLHVQTVTSGFDAMSCHLVVAGMSRGREALREVRRTMKDNFGSITSLLKSRPQKGSSFVAGDACRLGETDRSGAYERQRRT